MISLEEAQARLIALAELLPAETVPIGEALGRWTAEPIVATRTQPARDLSAMDGYALEGGSAGPWQVIGESAAGQPFAGRVGSQEAVRIFTGAALPDGADAIIIQEDVDRSGDLIKATVEAVAGRHVRPCGSDFHKDDTLVEAGVPLTPARLALAAIGRHGSLSVRRKPRVAILATGNELVPTGTDPGADKLPESNSLMVAAQLAGLQVEVTLLGIIPDDLQQITAAIRSADADLLITSGGASVGDHDLVKPALEACGAEMEFLKVAMRPGKPVMAGRIGAMRVIGLPGNPVSAYVTTLLFVMPLLRAMLGASGPLPIREAMRLTSSLPAVGPRTDHVRARIAVDGVEPIGINDSAQLNALAHADALIVRPAGANSADAGDTVNVIRLF